MSDTTDTGTPSPTLATATLAGGCFWCLEAVYAELAGVRSVESGYTGGHLPEPSYQQVCTGATGHAEAVRVRFDPAQISYRDLLQVFFSIHDPTTVDRQGNDVGPQYRSAIFCHDEAQRVEAEAVLREVDASGIHGAPLVTEVQPAGAFYPAEPYHRNFFAQNPDQAYCRVVIAPKVAKFRKQHVDRLKRTAATES
ncbi:MAG: peptide-methionine (S)-S-oxide reductase MsrA [Deinococcales bacterium]